MIQPSKLDNMGKVKTCRIHDIVHDIAVSISRQENYAFIRGEHTSNIATRVGIWHLSCVACRKLNTTMDLSCVRSLTVFNEPLELTSLQLKFKMLRILDLKNASMGARQQDIKYIGLLVHLKYLHFPRNSKIYALPKSIGNLLGLRTLDIQKSRVSTLHTEITKLHNLRRHRCSRDHFNFYTFGIKLPRGVGKLKELQVLEKVDIKRTSWKAIKEIGELIQLKKIVVSGRGASKKKCKAFCEAAPKLSPLRSLNVNTMEYQNAKEAMDMVVSFTSPLPCLERLKLKGLLQKITDWVGKCEKLVKVDLEYCQLKELEALTELPYLVQLRLKDYAFNAENLVFHKDGFPKLRILIIQIHFGMALAEVTFEQSTSPNMKTIDIWNCSLTSGINGINHLPKLEKISIAICALGKQDMLREEVDNHTNHPVLHMSDLFELGEDSQK